MTVYADPEGTPYRKITQILVGDEPLTDERDYVVGSLDMFTFRIGYTTLSEGKDIRYFLPEFIRNVLEHELKDLSAVFDSSRKRWILETGLSS